MNILRVYVDTEYAYPGMTREKGRPTSNELRQIVQISAIVYEFDSNYAAESGKEMVSFDVLTWPHYLKELPEFFVELTGITQDQLKERAVPFEEGYLNFRRFVHYATEDEQIWTFDRDQEVFEQNCKYAGIFLPFRNNFIRVKQLLPLFGIDPEQYSSGTLFRAVGLQMEGHVHNALHDVRSMAQAVYLLEKRACHRGEFLK